jgi:hypothetical protein
VRAFNIIQKDRHTHERGNSGMKALLVLLHININMSWACVLALSSCSCTQQKDAFPLTPSLPPSFLDTPPTASTSTPSSRFRQRPAKTQGQGHIFFGVFFCMLGIEISTSSSYAPPSPSLPPSFPPSLLPADHHAARGHYTREQHRPTGGQG